MILFRNKDNKDNIISAIELNKLFSRYLCVSLSFSIYI
jgi:hypothetical protein